MDALPPDVLREIGTWLLDGYLATSTRAADPKKDVNVYKQDLPRPLHTPMHIGLLQTLPIEWWKPGHAYNALVYAQKRDIKDRRSTQKHRLCDLFAMASVCSTWRAALEPMWEFLWPQVYRTFAAWVGKVKEVPGCVILPLKHIPFDCAWYRMAIAYMCKDGRKLAQSVIDMERVSGRPPCHIGAYYIINNPTIAMVQSKDLVRGMHVTHVMCCSRQSWIYRNQQFLPELVAKYERIMGDVSDLEDMLADALCA